MACFTHCRELTRSRATPSRRSLSRVLKAFLSKLRYNVVSALGIPPTVRSKCQCQGITKVAKWAQQILDQIGGKGKAVDGSDLSKLRKAFAGIAALRPFQERFCHPCAITELFQELRKTEGLNGSTYTTTALEI